MKNQALPVFSSKDKSEKLKFPLLEFLFFRALRVKQATCTKQACIHLPKQANALKCTIAKSEYLCCLLNLSH